MPEVNDQNDRPEPQQTPLGVMLGPYVIKGGNPIALEASNRRTALRTAFMRIDVQNSGQIAPFRAREVVASQCPDLNPAIFDKFQKHGRFVRSMLSARSGLAHALTSPLSCGEL